MSLTFYSVGTYKWFVGAAFGTLTAAPADDKGIEKSVEFTLGSMLKMCCFLEIISIVWSLSLLCCLKNGAQIIIN